MCERRGSHRIHNLKDDVTLFSLGLHYGNKKGVAGSEGGLIVPHCCWHARSNRVRAPRDKLTYAVEREAGHFDTFQRGKEPPWYKMCIMQSQGSDTSLKIPFFNKSSLTVCFLSIGSALNTQPRAFTCHPEWTRFTVWVSGGSRLGCLVIQLSCVDAYTL